MPHILGTKVAHPQEMSLFFAATSSGAVRLQDLSCYPGRKLDGERVVHTLAASAVIPGRPSAEFIIEPASLTVIFNGVDTLETSRFTLLVNGEPWWSGWTSEQVALHGILGPKTASGFSIALPAGPGTDIERIVTLRSEDGTGLGGSQIRLPGHRRYIGCVDSVAIGEEVVDVTGWCIDKLDPAAKVDLSLFADFVNVFEGTTGQYRPDVFAAGHGGLYAGFTMAAPRTAFRGNAYLQVRPKAEIFQLEWRAPAQATAAHPKPLTRIRQRQHDEIHAHVASLFDPDWYALQAGKKLGLSEPLVHYMSYGWRAGISPSPYISLPFYLAQRHAEAKDIEPLGHYLSDGEADGLQPHPLFDALFYAKQRGHFGAGGNAVAAQGAGGELLDYVRNGWRRGLRPHPLFWSDWYSAKYSVATDPLLHFITCGWQEGRSPNPLFDTNHYIKLQGHRLGGLDPLSHYVLFGFRDHCSPHPLVDLSWYASQLTDKPPKDGDLLAYYLAGHGDAEPCFYIDPGFYWKRVGEPMRFATINGSRRALIDFLERGGVVAPHPHFSPSYYLKQRPDVQAAGLNPLTHYADGGWREEGSPHPLFDKDFYLQQHPHLLQSGTEPLRHYLTTGSAEGDTPRPARAPVTSVRRLDMNGRTVRIPRDNSARGMLAVGTNVPAPRIAVFAHIFYEDLAARFAELINNIPQPCTTFITTNEYSKARAIRAAFAGTALHTYEIRVTPNRGRDIAPMLTAFADRLQEFDIGLHIHTKKSPHYGGSGFDDWRLYLLENLLGTRHVVNNVLSLFEHPEVGVVAPKDFEPVAPLVNWGGNFESVAAVLELMDETIEIDSILEIPSGSMFWFRKDALRPLFELGLDTEHFESEANQTDGTLAHAIERSFFFVSEAAGYGWVRTQLVKAGETSWLGGSIPICRIMPPRRLFKGLGVHFPECLPFAALRLHSERPRLNLLLPTIEPAKAYAGVAAALDVYHATLTALNGDADGRMIATDVPFSNMFVPPNNHIVTDPAALDTPCRNTVLDGTTRKKYYLGVRQRDIFLVSAWWNAAAAFQLMDWQAVQFGSPMNRLLYMVQDFEPEFYPWSTKFMLASETYTRPEVTIPIFNTGLLANFFREREIFTWGHVLEPAINPAIKAAISYGTAKERIILLYVRPHADRNCFEFIDCLVAHVVSQDPGFWNDWRFIAAGEDLSASPFRCGHPIELVGKLPLSRYGSLLSRAALGISLMASPHPSYPPLEMAEAGVRVLVNRFGDKDLSTIHANISVFDRFDIHEAGHRLWHMARAWESEPDAGWKAPAKANWFFNSNTNLMAIAEALAAEVVGERRHQL